MPPRPRRNMIPDKKTVADEIFDHDTSFEEALVGMTDQVQAASKSLITNATKPTAVVRPFSNVTAATVAAVFETPTNKNPPPSKPTTVVRGEPSKASGAARGDVPKAKRCLTLEGGEEEEENNPGNVVDAPVNFDDVLGFVDIAMDRWAAVNALKEGDDHAICCPESLRPTAATMIVKDPSLKQDPSVKNMDILATRAIEYLMSREREKSARQKYHQQCLEEQLQREKEEEETSRLRMEVEKREKVLAQRRQAFSHTTTPRTSSPTKRAATSTFEPSAKRALVDLSQVRNLPLLNWDKTFRITDNSYVEARVQKRENSNGDTFSYDSITLFRPTKLNSTKGNGEYCYDIPVGSIEKTLKAIHDLLGHTNVTWQ
jgi:hypothetical protein